MGTMKRHVKHPAGIHKKPIVENYNNKIIKTINPSKIN
jgi:hypothetical protein